MLNKIYLIVVMKKNLIISSSNIKLLIKKCQYININRKIMYDLPLSDKLRMQGTL